MNDWKKRHNLTREELKNWEIEHEKRNQDLNEMHVDCKKHINLGGNVSCIDYSYDNPYSSFTEELLSHLITTFPGKNIEIYSLLRSDEEISGSLVNRLLGAATGLRSSYIGHFSYGKIIIDPSQLSMNVTVVDPTLNVESPYLQAILGASVPLERRSHNFFRNLAHSLNLELSHNYHYRWSGLKN